MMWYGQVAIWFLRRHYSREVRPWADARGVPRSEILAAAHRALDREFAKAWPDDLK